MKVVVYVDYEHLVNLIKSCCLSMNCEFGPIPRIRGAADYYRWLKYKPEEMRKRIDAINKKSEVELSLTELKEKKAFIEEEYMLKQLESYFGGNIFDCDCVEIKRYLETHPLNDLIFSRLTEEEIRLAHEKYNELINNKDINQFGSLLIDDEESILNYAPESMTDFYAMELYSGFCEKHTISGLREDMWEAYKKNASASGKTRRYTI